MAENDFTPEPLTKKCRACRQVFPATIEYFETEKHNKGGLISWCRACMSLYSPLPKQRVLVETKRCSRCGDNQPATEFFKNNSTTDGLSCWCKSCYREYETHYTRSAESIVVPESKPDNIIRKIGNSSESILEDTLSCIENVFWLASKPIVKNIAITSDNITSIIRMNCAPMDENIIKSIARLHRVNWQ